MKRITSLFTGALFCLLGLLSMNLYSQALPELLYYKFDVPGSTIINHASNPVGTNPAPIVGTDLSIGGTGLVGSALVGIGGSSTNSYVNTGWATSLSGSFTIAFWTSNITPSSTLWYIWGDANASSFRCFTNGVAGANNWMVRGGGFPDVEITGGATTAANMCHFVYDATAGEARAYVDGVLVKTVAVTAAINVSGSNFTIGGYSTSSGLSGNMDEFRIYSRALTQTEITNTYNVPLGSLYAIDAGAHQISSPVSPIAPGSYPVKVSIRSYGDDTLTSATIGWSVNGVNQTSYSWTGQLGKFDIDTGIVLGSFNFPLGTHEIKAWTSLPNGNLDSAAFNDTAVASIICAQVLNGIYTIGGVNPDYANITLAVNDLNAAGVSGPVTFIIAPGIYNEQMTLNEVLGASATNRVMFQSSTGNADDVTIKYNASGSSDNWTVYLNGADYIDIQNLTIWADDSTYARALVLGSGADYNNISGCKIISQEMARGTSNSAGIYDGSGNDNFNIYSNNEIWNGYYGAYIYGSGSASLQQGTIFENNLVQDFYYYGVYFYYHDAPKVNGNTVLNHSSSGTMYALNCYYCDNQIEVTKNRVDATGTGTQYAMRIAYCDATDTAMGIVANNMVTVNGSSSGTNYASYWYYCSYQKFYNNSSYVTAGSSSSRAAYIYNGNDNYSMNNIFANVAGGYSVYLYGSPLLVSDYNNYYSTGTPLGYWGSNVADLTALQLASGQDLNSLSLDPLYAIPDLLFPGSVAMNNAGTPLAEVVDDYYGTIRSLTSPDMGCVEYTPPQDDAGIVSIDSPSNPQSPGSHSISATIKNFGLVNMNTCNLNFSVNGGPTVSTLWVGNLAPGGTDGPNTIGSFNFPIGQHEIKVWTSDPNLQNDGNALNDTMVMTLNVCNIFSGNYLIGDTNQGADYASFNDAIGALMNCGIGGTVIFNVDSGTYVEQVSMPEVPGASFTNRVVFQSATGNAADVVLTYAPSTSSAPWVWCFDGADFIDLSQITVEVESSATYGHAVYFQNGATYNVVNGLVITNLATTSSSYSGIYSTTSSADEFNVISNNTITGGYYGIYFYASSSALETGNIFENNTITDYYYYGMYIGYQFGHNIMGNYMHNAASSGVCYGIRNYYCDGPQQIRNNRIELDGSSTTYGMYIYYNDASDQDPGVIANNWIAQTNPSAGTTYGLYNSGSTYQQFYHNSVSVFNTSGSAYVMYFTGSATVGNEYVNNIFSHFGGGRAVYLGSSSYISGISWMDHNNLYTTGATLAYASASYSTLADWTAFSGTDSNSVSTDPMFSSPALLYPSSSVMDNMGTPLAQVSDDIYGNPRSMTTPDIGAVEYTPPQNDAGISSIDGPGTPLGPGMFAVSATVKNYGLSNLSSCYLNFSVNGGPATSYYWVGILEPDSTEGPITIGNHTFGYGTHELKVWTSNPNNGTDGNHINDTLTMTITVCDIVSGTFYIGDTAAGADFPSFQTAVNSLSGCGIGDTVLFLVDSGMYNEQLTIPFIPGGDTNARVIFQPASGNANDVVIHYAPSSSASYYVVALDDADYITFRDITIKVDNGATYGRALLLQNGADHNEFINCKIQTIDTTSSNFYACYSPNTMDEYNLFDNCEFSGGYYNFYLYGSGGGEMMNIIRNCRFEDWYYYGVYLYYQHSVQFTNNYIHNGTLSNTAYAFRNYYCFGPFETSHNHIELDNSGTGYGLYVYYSDGDATNPAKVYNNVVNKLSGTASYLTYIGYSSNVQFYHNTLNSQASGTSGYGMYMTAGSSGIEMVNNMITTSVGRAIYLGSSTYLSGISLMNYNNIYTGGSELAYASASYPTLADWQAFSGLDSNSTSTDPGYLTTSNLTPSVATVNNLATPVSWVMDDFFGNPRPANPDMGAIEFDPLAFEAEMVGFTAPTGGCDLGFVDVSVKILNRGAATINDSLTATYWVEGTSTVVTEAVTDSIVSNDTLEFTFSTPVDLSTPYDSTFKIYGWINLAGDPVPENDSAMTLVASNLSPLPPMVSNVTIAQGDSATLSVINPDTNLMYFWYDSLIGGNELADGDTFVTPPLSQTTVYYVASTSGSQTYNIGATDPSIGSSSVYTSSNHYLLIDVLSPNGATIVTTDIYPSAAIGSPFTIELQNSSSAVIATYSGVVSVSSGPQTVPVNFYLPMGTGYRLGMGTNPGVLRNSTGGAYPYTVPGLMSITGNTFNATYYYFNYNMFIAEGQGGAGNGCFSARVPDTVFVIQPIVQVNAGNDVSICLGSSAQLNVTASGGVSPYTYAWSPSSSLSNANIANPVATPITNTTYSVTVTDQNGDTGTDDVIVLVNPGPNVTFNLPVDTLLNIDPPYTLSGGSPSGGTYSGTGVSAGQFDPGAVTPAQSYTITYSYTDPVTGCSGTATADVFVKIWVGIDEVENGLAMRVYPNPSEGLVNITLYSDNPQLQLRVVDIRGKELFSQSVLNTSGIMNHSLDLRNLPAGVYTLRLESEHYQKSVRLILQ